MMAVHKSVDKSVDNDQPVQDEKSFEANYLDAKLIRFRYEGETLTYTDAEGQFYPRVSLRRCFPLSAENTFIAVRLPGAEIDRSEELGVIADAGELDEVSRQTIEREMHLYYLVPKIEKIRTIREEFGFLYWDVETDRGEKEFIMRDNITGSTRRIAANRWLIIDINQTRYEVHEVEALDEKSQEYLKKYLLL